MARKHLRGKKKVHAVLSEFKRGTLRSGSGEKVKNRKQAVAIALSEAGLSRRSKMPKDAKMSPEGDLGKYRQEESSKAGGFKDGHVVSAAKALPVSSPKKERDPLYVA